MRISEWLSDERPREKLLSKGPESLSDAELLAILLRTGTKGKTAVDLSRELLFSAGGLGRLLQSNKEMWCNHTGVGIAKYVQFKAALELANRYLRQQIGQGKLLDETDKIKDYLLSNMRHLKIEVFACIFLNKKDHLIEFETLFYGTVDSSVVYTREIIKKALSYNATSVIFAHNHPSGITTPSQADKIINSQLICAMDLVSIAVRDHYIVGDGEVFSFAENMLM